MSTLIAIGYPDETTATAAADEAERLAGDLIIQPDAIAVIRRDREGKYHVTTNHHAVGAGAPAGRAFKVPAGALGGLRRPPESDSQPSTLSLKKSLHKEVEKRIVCTVNKEMSGRPIPDIEALLNGHTRPEELPVA